MDLSPQQKRIMTKLNAGAVLTSLSAWQFIGVAALSQQCSKLIAKGYPIRRTPFSTENRYGEPVNIKMYDIAKDDRK